MNKLLAASLVVAFSMGVYAQNSAPKPIDSQEVFDQLWTILEEYYALFTANGIDLKVLYGIYRPRILPETTDEQLFVIVTSLLGHLNDTHVMLRSDDPPRFSCAGYTFEGAKP